MQVIRTMVTIIEPQTLDAPICRDSDDDPVLAAALGGEVACIVTGDKDLLVLKKHRGIPILSTDKFWRVEEQLGS